MRITRIAVLSLLLLPLFAGAPAWAADGEALPALQNMTPAATPASGDTAPPNQTHYCYWENDCYICEIYNPGSGLFCIQRMCPLGDSQDCWYV